MSDAERQEHDRRRPDDAPTGPRGPAPDPGDPDAPAPDALGAWPAGPREEAAMAEQTSGGSREASAVSAADAPDGGDGGAEEAHDAEAGRAEAQGAEVDERAGGAGQQESPAEGSPADESPWPEDDPRSRRELIAALADAEQQRDEYLDGVRRARAEFENFRKRTMREGATQREAGKAELAEGLLEVLDDLDRTLDAADASQDESLARGVQLVAEKLVASLRAAGLERIEETGVPFDPNRHDAVQQTDAEEPRDEPVVAQVLRPGYALGERVLRAAMVVVEQ